MSQLKNGVEEILITNNPNNYVSLPAVAADIIEKDALAYWDTSANVVKKFAPADSTVNYTYQNKIIGTFCAGKKIDEVEALVCVDLTVLGKVSSPFLGAQMVIVYTVATNQYTFQETTAYNTAVDPDITLTGGFATCETETAEKDGRGKIRLNGAARLAALT